MVLLAPKDGAAHTQGVPFPLSYSSRQIPNLRGDPKSSQVDKDAKISHYFNPPKEVKAEQMCTDLMGGGWEYVEKKS